MYLIVGDRGKQHAIGVDPTLEIVDQAVREQKVVAFADAKGRLGESRSFCCQPILRNHLCIGAIFVGHREVGAVSHPAAMAFISQCAGLVGQCLWARAESPIQQMGENPLGMVGESVAIRGLCSRMQRLLTCDPFPRVVLLGDIGVGKSYLAKQLHLARGGSPETFVAVDCGAIPAGVFEAELFGTTAYAGNTRPVPGYFAKADGGTLFLDEIANMPTGVQTQLLVALSSGFYRVIGSKELRPIRCNLISGTNADLRALVMEGKFRRDLRDRLQDVVYRVPSLQERGEADIRLLASLFIGKRLRFKDPGITVLERHLSPAAIHRVLHYAWPGNIRQLEAIFSRNPDIGHLLEEGIPLRTSDLDAVLADYEAETLGESAGMKAGEGPSPNRIKNMTYEAVRAQEHERTRAYVRRCLEKNRGNKSKTARDLKISRSHLESILTGSAS